ncbi:MAG: hypothetical protein CMJ89_19115 [Planctomycetes bacterium]|nr:hypothetical protein [Planctomycetota bacterium]
MTPLSRRTVLVTGATGFVGTALVEELLREGARVHAVARESSNRAHLDRFSIHWHTADLEDVPALHRAFAKAAEEAKSAGRRFDCVHAGALISYRREDAERSRRVNVGGTHNILEASIASGVQRICHVSSVVAVGFARSAEEVLDEETPFNGAGLRSAYVTTKRAAEDLVLAVQVPPETVVCCPGAIFGPSPGGSNTTRFLERLRRGGLGPFAPPGSLSVVGVDDVAKGLCLALQHGRPGRRYLLTESNWSHTELLARAAVELGVRSPRVRFPPPLWRGVVGAAGLLDPVIRSAEATPEALRLLGTHFRFDGTRARSELGWLPRPFVEVLRETVLWMGSRKDRN